MCTVMTHSNKATDDKNNKRRITELKILQHTKPTLIKKTGKQRAQTPYVYLSREALKELDWELNKIVTVEYDIVHSRITIRETPTTPTTSTQRQPRQAQDGEQNGAAILISEIPAPTPT